LTLFAHENDFNDAFLAAALANKIPVSVLKGFTALESAFNPNAYRAEAGLPQVTTPSDGTVVPDASYGLMQILFSTAQGAGFQGDPNDLFDPKTNVTYGAAFLAGLLKKYPNVLDAIAAYNMGTPRAAGNTTDKIIAIYGQPGPDWAYANQPYVDRVASYIAYYQALENANAAKAAAVLDLIKKKIMRVAATFLDRSLSDSSKDQWPGR
jgi:soluble lytic murein transglycosylase-like protein